MTNTTDTNNTGSKGATEKELMIPEEFVSITKELDEAFYDIPFENSAFQNENFVVNMQLTPARAYRAIGLRLSAKMRALKEAYFGRKMEEIDLAELEEKRDNPSLSKFDRQRAEVEIEKKLSQRQYTQKLINDAVCEVRTLHGLFKKLPRYTRQQFELEERQHFEIRLQNQINGIQGASESMLAMQHTVTSQQAIAQFSPNLALGMSESKAPKQEQQSIASSANN